MSDFEKMKSKSHCFLDVWDFSIRDNTDFETSPQSIAQIRKPADTEAEVKSLPPQDESSVRVFIEECCDVTKWTQEAKDRYNPPLQLPSQNGFRSLLAQIKGDGSQWHELDAFDIALDASDSGSYSMARNKISLRLAIAAQTGVDKLISSMEQYRDRWARTSRKLVTVSRDDGRHAVYISCATALQSNTIADRLLKGPEGQSPFESTEKFAKEFSGLLKTTYLPIMTKDNWIGMISLLYYHANFNVFVDFLQQVTKDYTELRGEQFDPRSSRLQNWLVWEIKKDAYCYRQFQKVGDEMATTLQSMLGLLDVTIGRHWTGNEYAALTAEVQGSCNDMKLCLSRFTEDLEHSLKLLDLSRNFRQNNSVQRLTVLATLFLPMSLATGILSMGTRFKDLGPLLYDFFGVLVLVMTLVVVYLAVMFLLEHKLKYLRLPAMFLTFVVVAGYGPLVLSSFLVGMFHDVVLGAKILGFGTAASVVVIPTAALLALGVALGIQFWKSSRRRKRERNRKGSDSGEPQGSSFLEEALRAASLTPRSTEYLEDQRVSRRMSPI